MRKLTPVSRAQSWFYEIGVITQLHHTDAHFHLALKSPLLQGWPRPCSSPFLAWITRSAGSFCRQLENVGQRWRAESAGCLQETYGVVCSRQVASSGRVESGLLDAFERRTPSSHLLWSERRLVDIRYLHNYRRPWSHVTLDKQMRERLCEQLTTWWRDGWVGSTKLRKRVWITGQKKFWVISICMRGVLAKVAEYVSRFRYGSLSGWRPTRWWQLIKFQMDTADNWTNGCKSPTFHGWVDSHNMHITDKYSAPSDYIGCRGPIGATGVDYHFFRIASSARLHCELRFHWDQSFRRPRLHWFCMTAITSKVRISARWARLVEFG